MRVRHRSAFSCCISLTDPGEHGPNSNCFFIKQAFGTFSFYWRKGDSAIDSIFLWEVTKHSEGLVLVALLNLQKVLDTANRCSCKGNKLIGKEQSKRWKKPIAFLFSADSDGLVDRGEALSWQAWAEFPALSHTPLWPCANCSRSRLCLSCHSSIFMS